MVKCPLCGHCYEPDGSHCAGCPLSRGCQLTCCPNCGYTLPPEPTLVKLWRRMRNKGPTETERYAGKTETHRRDTGSAVDRR